MITQISRTKDGRLRVRGVASDDGAIRKVVVNGLAATAAAANFAEWEIVLDKAKAGDKITAHAEDATGNVETHAHITALAY